MFYLFLSILYKQKLHFRFFITELYNFVANVKRLMEREAIVDRLEVSPKPDDAVSRALSVRSKVDPKYQKDGRQAWIVCVASFLIQVWVIGILHAFGVFFVAFLEEFGGPKASAGKHGVNTSSSLQLCTEVPCAFCVPYKAICLVGFEHMTTRHTSMVAVYQLGTCFLFQLGLARPPTAW